MTRVPSTIPAVVDDAARRFGDADALVDDERTVSFASLAAQVDEAAAALVNSGVRPGDRVSVWAPSSIGWAVAGLAAYAAGAVLVPVNTRFKVPEARQVLARARVRLVFTVSGFLDLDFPAMLEQARPLPDLGEVVLIDDAAGGGATPWASFAARADDAARHEVARRKAALAPGDVCDVVFTSGTTGRPKGAMLCHGPSVATYETWTDQIGLRAGDRFLVVFPYFQTSGLKSGILACLLRGAANVPQAVFDVDEVVRRVTAHRISVLPGPPTAFHMILERAAAGADLSSLRIAVTGGAATPVELVRRMQSELGLDSVVTAYGLTETTGLVSMCRQGDPPELVAGSVGRPVPGVEVRAVDASGADVAPGDPGELLVRGGNVMAGYLDDPEATAAAIDGGGWLHTGDVGTVDADGIVRITDRLKDMFIVGGFNAYPAEIEAALTGHPAVGQVAVVGVPDERLGEVGAAFVVPAAGATVDADELRAWCRERMANYKVPRSFHPVEALPLNANGKVLKGELRSAAPHLLGGTSGQPG